MNGVVKVCYKRSDVIVRPTVVDGASGQTVVEVIVKPDGAILDPEYQLSHGLKRASISSLRLRIDSDCRKQN